MAEPKNGGQSLLAISATDFVRVLDEVETQYEFVSLEEGLRPSNMRRAVITFDDGYADNFHTAAPILQGRAIPATFFISSGFIEKQSLFPSDALDALFGDQVSEGQSIEIEALRSAGYWRAHRKLSGATEDYFWRVIGELSSRYRDQVLADDSLRRPMTKDELASLAAIPGFSVGPHTVSHRRLSSLSDDDAMSECDESISALEQWSFRSIPFFAYPFGQRRDMSGRLTRSLAAKGYRSLSTLPVAVSPVSRFFLGRNTIPRLSIGPAEVPLISTLSKLLPVVSVLPHVWLAALALRRGLRAFGSLAAR